MDTNLAIAVLREPSGAQYVGTIVEALSAVLVQGRLSSHDRLHGVARTGCDCLPQPLDASGLEPSDLVSVPISYRPHAHGGKSTFVAVLIASVGLG
jgi:hypothetical protein